MLPRPVNAPSPTATAAEQAHAAAEARRRARAREVAAHALAAHRAGRTAAAVAAGLALGKLIAGQLGHSVAVTASAVDSLMDVFASSANAVAIRLAHARPDEGHPFGHAKIEALAIAAQGLLIGGSGVYLLIEGKGDSTRPPPSGTAAKASGASPWAAAVPEMLDKRDLPSANLPPASPRSERPPASEKPADRKAAPMPLWLRLSVVVVLLLLVAGVVKRMRLTSQREAANPTRSVATAPPLPPEELTAEPTATAQPTRDLAARAPAADLTADPAASADAPADPSADPSASAARPPPRLAPPPPRPTYKPLFEMPTDKPKE
jgi:Cation efflux family